MLTVKLQRSYTSKNGNKTFVYSVAGTPDQIEKYKAIQGDNFREAEDGTPLWFTTRCIGSSGTLIITTNNRIVPDMSEYDQAASLASQYGGNLGQALANAAAEKLMGKVGQINQATPVPVKEKAEDLDKL